MTTTLDGAVVAVLGASGGLGAPIPSSRAPKRRAGGLAPKTVRYIHVIVHRRPHSSLPKPQRTSSSPTACPPNCLRKSPTPNQRPRKRAAVPR